MTIEERIQKAKDAFTEKFAEQDPYALAMIAAAQRANPYSPGTTHDDIRKEWASQLRIITSKYVIPQDVETFISDVLVLREHMNAMFPGRFNSGKTGYSDGFKVAHAQKSISVCLKHLWRERSYSVAPPVCPVDGIMLKHVKNRDAWTKVDSIEDLEDGIMGYRSHLALMEKAAKEEGFASVAEWELVVWWEGTSGKQTSKKKRIRKTGKKEVTDVARGASGANHLGSRTIIRREDFKIGDNVAALVVGKGGVGIKGKSLPYYCSIILTEKNADIRKVLREEGLEPLLEMFPAAKARDYIFNNDSTSREDAEALYGKAKHILSTR